MVAFIVIPPDKLEQARVMYEEGEETTAEIAAFLGISKPTFCNRIRMVGWRRRRRSPSPERAAKAAARAFSERTGEKAPPADLLELTANRLRARVLMLQATKLLDDLEARADARAADEARAAEQAAEVAEMRVLLKRRIDALAPRRDEEDDPFALRRPQGPEEAAAEAPPAPAVPAAPAAPGRGPRVVPL